MPELPEVETIKSAIQKGIGDSNITRVSVNNNRFREIIPEDFAAKITGARITGYRRIAKYIVISLDNGLSIVWHLGMSGRVKISDSLPDKLDKHDHVVIETSGGVLIYNDARRFGMMTYCISDKLAEFPAFKHTGIDPFDQRLTAEYLYEKLKNKKNGHQNCPAGSGDYLRNRQYICLRSFVRRLHSADTRGRQPQPGRMRQTAESGTRSFGKSNQGRRFDTARLPQAGRQSRLFSEPALRLQQNRTALPGLHLLSGPHRGNQENRSGRTFNLLLSHQTKVKSHDKKHL